MQNGINHHGRRQAAMKITSKLNTINAPVNIDTSFLLFHAAMAVPTRAERSLLQLCREQPVFAISIANIYPTCPKTQDTLKYLTYFNQIYSSAA